MDLSTYRGWPHGSPSSLNRMLNICSLPRFIEKVQKLPRPFTPVALAVGSASHRVMEWIVLHHLPPNGVGHGENIR
jgi:hypothetical protein